MQPRSRHRACACRHAPSGAPYPDSPFLATPMQPSGAHLVQELWIRAASILWAELNVGAAKAAQVLHGSDRVVNDFLAAHAQLVLHVDLAGGDERVHARQLRALNGVPRALQVRNPGATQTTDDRHVAIFTDIVADHVGDLLHRQEIIIGSDRKSGFNYVNAELGELARNVELLFGRERGTGRLLAVAQRGVENADVIWVTDFVGHVLGPGAAQRHWRGRAGRGRGDRHAALLRLRQRRLLLRSLLPPERGKREAAACPGLGGTGGGGRGGGPPARRARAAAARQHAGEGRTGASPAVSAGRWDGGGGGGGSGSAGCFAAAGVPPR
eukprot:86396-Chlamydomonas_euryale.AAC.6